MRQVFVDKFIVPKQARKEFLDKMQYNRTFIRNLQGFVSDAAYKREDDLANCVVITVAIWENEAALAAAKEVVQAEYRRIGFNPSEMYARLKITIERGTFSEIPI